MKGDLVLRSGGSLSCSACHGSIGGCLDILGSLDQEEHGSASFQDCRAARYGGALAVKTGVRLGGDSTFRTCTSGLDRSQALGGGEEARELHGARQHNTTAAGSMASIAMIAPKRCSACNSLDTSICRWLPAQLRRCELCRHRQLYRLLHERSRWRCRSALGSQPRWCKAYFRDMQSRSRRQLFETEMRAVVCELSFAAVCLPQVTFSFQVISVLGSWKASIVVEK